MPRVTDQALPLQHWCVLSLRPRGQHAGLRAAATRRGARTVALSPFATEARSDEATRASLQQSLRADIVLYTSPNAVAVAAAAQSLQPKRGQTVLAVGSGTRRALHRLGIDARAPSRMDSEGLLAMPQLADVAGHRIGLITGLGGRNMLAPALRKRGAEVLRVDVYARMSLLLTPGAAAKLRDALAAPSCVLLPLSSDEALQRLLAQLPAALRQPFARIAVVAASARLAEVARAAGFRRIAMASDARPASLLRAAIDAFVDDAIV
ncbi:MAG: uroporphyrinogen-III synthase [Lysobacteraceae bacterium]|nr:MAG: uroporphyrinogen-III synthase [Xanthomonadaceae bacterium]